MLPPKAAPRTAASNSLLFLNDELSKEDTTDVVLVYEAVLVRSSRLRDRPGGRLDIVPRAIEINNVGASAGRGPAYCSRET